VLQVWPDASEDDSGSKRPGSEAHSDQSGGSNASSGGFKALVSLDRQTLRAGDESLRLVAGMQVVAEVREGRRTVLEYLLSPIKGALHDSARER
jgi:HlyD family secretion protein